LSFPYTVVVSVVASTWKMASIQSGQNNTLASPREFGNLPEQKTPRMHNVFERQAGGTTQVAIAAAEPVSSGKPPELPHPSTVPRDPRCPQTRNSLWEREHDWTKADDSDNFAHRAGGEAGVISVAGHGRIKKQCNLTEIDFYTRLTEPMGASLAPKFCGHHTSNGKDWTHYVILEDLTLPYSKPAVLDIQLGQQHAGPGAPGCSEALGLRVNGVRLYTGEGLVHYSKEWGGKVTTTKFAEVLEDFLTDAVGTLRAEVAGVMVSALDKVEAWVSAQTGLRLLGTSLLVVYEGDTTVAEPTPACIKMIDFEHVELASENVADKGYLTGIRNLRWMLERLVAWCELQAAKEDTRAGRGALHEVRSQLREAQTKCSAAEKKAQALAPDKGLSASTYRVLHEDIAQDDVANAVTQQEDSVIAGFLKSVLCQHHINPGADAFVELLQWRTQPLVLDRCFVKDLFQKYGMNEAAVDDVLKWKETSDTRLRRLAYVVDVKLSATEVLPSYYDLLVKQDEIQQMLCE